MAAYHQPHTVSVQLNFLRPVHGDLAIFRIKDVKLGGQISVVQVVLIQYYGDLFEPLTTLDPGRIGEEIATGYMTNANTATFKGPITNGPLELQPAPSPVDLERLRRDIDELWKFQGSMVSLMPATPQGYSGPRRKSGLRRMMTRCNHSRSC